jgi:hypothetical protein
MNIKILTLNFLTSFEIPQHEAEIFSYISNVRNNKEHQSINELLKASYPVYMLHKRKCVFLFLFFCAGKGLQRVYLQIECMIIK